MKQPALTLLLVVASLFGARASEVTELEVRNAAGQSVALDFRKESLVKFWLQQLVLSALYRDVIQDSTVSEWTTALNSDAFILCHYPANSMLALPERSALTFDQILFPGSWNRKSREGSSSAA